MKFKLKLNKDAWAALSDEHKALYVEDGKGGYKLEVDDSEVAEEMRRARDREKQRADEAQTAADEIRARLEEIEGNNARKTGDIQTIENSWKEKLRLAEAAKDTKINALQNQLGVLLVDNIAATIAAEISVSPALILPHIKQRLSADLDGDAPSTRVLDSAGKLSALSVDELKQEFIDNADFAPIIIGSKASGSGATGGNKGGGAAKKPSDYTEQERTELYRRDPAKFAETFPSA
ncbi:scaffold protein [Xanthomonas phage XAJ2]|uniref:Scaffold protein n=1 Tax=Xanthomonas phage XAJ2 TaxID=1775249 RepID=A0A1I9L2D9_9CAUD|nr:scaffold protein [Xanthomonas phage XAJ2]